jgi:hypothetical protein
LLLPWAEVRRMSSALIFLFPFLFHRFPTLCLNAI